MNEQRDRTFSILKALAILLVVTAHAAAPTYVSRFAYMVSVPAFFVCAGYFFRPDYLECKSTFVVRRVRRLYFPFVKWSLLFSSSTICCSPSACSRKPMVMPPEE